MPNPVGFTIMHLDRELLHIYIDENLKVSSEILGDWEIGVSTKLKPNKITLRAVEEWLETRLPDKHRDDIEYILKKYDLKSFMPLAMCRKSHGRNMTDFLWIRFDGEELTYNDIRLR